VRFGASKGETLGLKFLCSELSRKHLQDLDDAAIDKLLRGLYIAPATKTRVVHLISAFFRWSIREKHADTNPVRSYLAGATKKQKERLKSKHDPRETPFLPKEHVGAVFRALPAPIDLAFAVSALAGLRPGEVLSLDWGDIDLARGRIRVERQVRAGKIGPPKNGKPREVPIVGLRA